MARRAQKDQPAREQEKVARRLEEAGEAGGFVAEARRGPSGETPGRALPGRTIGEAATSYSSVGGAEEPSEWPDRVPSPEDVEAVARSEPEAATGAVHDVTFRPAPGGYVEVPGQKGRDIPFTGEVSSTRGSSFEEDPNTGRTAAEEEGEFIRESLERRTRGYESG